MIPILLRDLRGRLALLLLVAVVMYLLEPGFHQHGEPLPPDEAIGLSAVGISATLSYFAGLAMIVLLAGFVSEDRREGYSRLYFSYATRPLAFYGLRWLLAYAIAVGGAAVFLVVGQLLAWGEVRGGWSGMLLPAVSALIYGGLMALLSSALPRGDAWVAFLLFLPTFVPQVVSLGLQALPPALAAPIAFLLPPQGALQLVWQGLLQGTVVGGAVLFAAGYGLVWLAAGALVLRLRELP